MNEFALIAKYFRPLATSPGAFALEDDAAAITVPAGDELIITADAIIEGTHFLSQDPIASVAKKLLRVNLSDLAAKGARPLGYLLACLWRRGTAEAAIAEFARGLGEDQAHYGLALLGGDTTASDGPTAFSLTALGLAAKGEMIRRSGARPGDAVFLTGTLGDAGLGLRVLQGETIAGDKMHHGFLTQRFRLPEPRLAFMLAAREHIHSAIDVSDGLMADAGHIAETSGARLVIEVQPLPVSAAAAAWLAAGGERAVLATAGDDYEVCFTAPSTKAPALRAAADASHTRLTEVGHVEAGNGAVLVGEDGREIPLARAGYRHF
jgi:thiamine-monophosphate kinase